MGPEVGGEGVPLDDEEDVSSEEEIVSPRRTRRECAGGPCHMAAPGYKTKEALRAANGKCNVLLTCPTLQQLFVLLEVSLLEVLLYLFLTLFRCPSGHTGQHQAKNGKWNKEEL